MFYTFFITIPWTKLQIWFCFSNLWYMSTLTLFAFETSVKNPKGGVYSITCPDGFCMEVVLFNFGIKIDLRNGRESHK